MRKQRFTTKEAIDYLTRKEKRSGIKALCSTDPEERLNYEAKERRAKELRDKIQHIQGPGPQRATVNY